MTQRVQKSDGFLCINFHFSFELHDINIAGATMDPTAYNRGLV